MTLTRRGWMVTTGAALAALGLPVAAPADDASPSYAAETLRDELQWLRDTMMEVGVKPFAYSDETAWQSTFERTRAAITQPMTAWSFWLLAGSLFAQLNDGHVGVSAYELYVSARKNGLRNLPLILEIRPMGTYVAAQTSDEFPAETRIERIESLSGAEIATACSRLVGGQREILRFDFAASRIPPYLYATLGERTRYAVEGTTPEGKTVRATLPAMTIDELKAHMAVPQQPSSPNYTFSRIANGKVGYIDYRSCTDHPAFDRFLQQTFGEIKRSPVDGLIIDIRKNGGGDSSLNNDLWMCVTTKPFAQFGGQYVKVSDRLKREYGREKYEMIYGRDAWSAKNGSVLGGPSVDLIRPVKEADAIRYDGPVFLLIGNATFSSALSCAVAAKDYGLATIVGDETAEPVVSTGEVYSGRSPAVGLTFAFTTKLFLGPKSRPDGQGVVPDVRIVPTEADIRAGRDPVLAYAVRTATGTRR